MHAVILAAGRGSRMGEATESVPKAFLEIDERSLYDRQRSVLAERVDDITVVLGYEHDAVEGRLDGANGLVLERWDEFENAESLRLALSNVDDDVLVLNGDIVITPDAVDQLLDRFAAFDGEFNVVGCLPGIQDEHTAIRCDDDGTVVDYGMISGYRHAGIGIVSRRHREAAIDLLADNREEWYPLVYPETPTKRVVISPSRHLEINRPEDLETATDRLPLGSARSRDATR
jgi:choline kinase